MRHTAVASRCCSLLLVALAACGGSNKAPASAPAPTVPTAQASASPSASADKLGPHPQPAPPVPFTPPSPQVFEGPGRSKVWLLERHNLPLVTVAAMVPYGSASEPADKAGLAFAAADMLDEGAGKRDALAFSEAVNDLGAHFASSADRDASIVSVEVLSAKLDQALPLLASALAEPRHAERDWTRVRSLWENALKSRSHEPNEVARVVTTLSYYGEKHPYAHPPDGVLASPKNVLLRDVTRWHHSIWRPDATTFVVAGDVTPDQLRTLLTKSFASWKAPALPAPAVVTPEPPPQTALRTFVVDRPDAPQVVVSVARAAPSASDPSFAPLAMLNVALGGSFTSRLNQNLRETHGWTYGARSRFNTQRGAGMFVVRAAIRSDAIGPALGETKKEIARMAETGLENDELEKIRALLNGEALETYGALHGAAGSLASNAALGLLPDQDARELAAQRAATRQELAALAARQLELSQAIIVLVGPREIAAKALADNGMPKPTFVDSEGRPVAADAAASHAGAVAK